ncbi:MAG: mechanosensitive ion channel [Firmicutes bacterium]|nr:mechanosensitive ion channel [Bacillota bacterium]
MERKTLLKKVLVLALLVLCAGGAAWVSGAVGAEVPFQVSLNLSVAVLLRLALMVFSVLLVANLLLLLLRCWKPRSHRSRTMVTLISSLTKYAAALVILCWGLTILGVDVSTIVASVGILALIVGFGAESLIADVVTGVFMLFENQYNVGDIVEVDGFRGTVREIGIRTTSVMDSGGNVRIINNSEMKNILNRSDNASFSVCDIGIPYEADLEALEEQLPQLLGEIYEKHRDVLEAKPEYLGVQALDASAVVLRFVAEVSEKQIYAAQRLLNRELLLGLKKRGVECPYPQLDVHSR